MLPTDTTWEKPICCAAAQSTTDVRERTRLRHEGDMAVQRHGPAEARVQPVPRNYQPEAIRPQQPHALVTVQFLAELPLSSTPSFPASRKPAERTATAGTPLSPQARTAPGTVAAGVQIMASSGLAGVSATVGYACMPLTDSRPGLTG